MSMDSSNDLDERRQRKLTQMLRRDEERKLDLQTKQDERKLATATTVGRKHFDEEYPIMKSQIEDLNLEVDALLAARDIDIDMAEAIMRVELGSKVSDMSSKEIKRDLLLFAKKNPNLFLELASDDNVQLRNFGIKATELGIIKLTQDQRNFLWGSNDRPIMTVPFDEHPYTALAHWFKTDEGMEIYSNIEKRLK